MARFGLNCGASAKLPRSSLSCVLRDERGAIGVILAIAAVPLMLLVGLVLDAGKGQMARTSLQASVDAATIAAAAAFQDADREELVETVFQEMLDDSVVAVDDLDIDFDDDGGRVTVSADARVDTIFNSMFGVDEFDMSASASGSFGVGKAQLDLVMCIDATGSMYWTIWTAKQNAMRLEENLLAELDRREISIERLRTRVVFYRDYDPPDWWGTMKGSEFYDLPDERQMFHNFLAREPARGGGNWPEAGLECFNEAMNSDWAEPEDQYTIVLPVVAIWTDAPADHVGDWRNINMGGALYPADMPRTNEDLLAKWNNPMVIPQDFKTIALFGPQTGGWTELAQYPGFVQGGNVTDGIYNFVGSLADAISSNVSDLPARLVN